MSRNTETFFKYFPCSESLEAGGVYVLSCGRSTIAPESRYPPVAHPDHHNFSWDKGRVLDSYTFVYIPAGRGSFESKPSGVCEVKAGMLFIVFPGVWHRYKPDSETGWDEYWIEIAGESVKKFLDACPIKSQAPVIPITAAAKIYEAFLSIIETAETEPRGSEYILCSQAFSLLSLVIADSAAGKLDRGEKFEAIRAAKRMLIEQLGEPIDLPQLAAQLGMSYSLFRKTFKEITGFTPHQYRLNFRLHRASRMLRFGNAQIGTIARRLGFGSIYYFSEMFKKKTGKSPLQYRKNI